ncbi:MAG TPA: homoserine kinase [Burkholderiales bacterium]|nr:homoserine kinase [Burkholderiales bacterium]
MSVYTRVTPSQLADWLKRYPVGALTELRGIAAGIENTNYFVTTSHGRYVLTLFERLPAESLSFYLGLMAHLARHGIPCPAPIADHDNGLFSILNGKPAALVTRLPGAPVLSPTPAHCAQTGGLLAAMHVAGQSFTGALENPRGPKWWRETAPQVAPFLDEQRRRLLESELEVQSRYRFQDLPRGPIHADLFRDNVLWDGDRVGGVIDFYFAGVDAWLFDVAVTLNDWCVQPDGEIDGDRAMALLGAYHADRPFTAIERGAWPVMLRAASLRFWLSRLHDFHLPRPGELVHAHDPEHFRRILELRIRDEHELPWIE